MAEIPIRVRGSGLCAVHCPGHPAVTNAEILALARMPRELLGRQVRVKWVQWAQQQQPDPKPSWLEPYDALSEADQEADNQIGESLFCAGWRAARGGGTV